MNLMSELLKEVFDTASVGLKIIGAYAKEIEEADKLSSMLNDSLGIEFEPFVCIHTHSRGITGLVRVRETTALQLKHHLMLAGFKFRANKCNFFTDTAISFQIENYQIPVIAELGCLDFISTEMTNIDADEALEKVPFGDMKATQIGAWKGKLQ